MLFNSSNNLEKFSRLSRAGLEIYNTVGGLATAHTQGNLNQALLARIGLSDGEKFCPSFSFGPSFTKNSNNFQVLGPGGVRAEDISLNAGSNLVFENGFEAYASNEMKIRSKMMVVAAAELTTSTLRTEKKALLDVDILGQLKGASYSCNDLSSSSSRYYNSMISATGPLHIEIGSLSMPGGNICCNSLSGYIGDATLSSMFDTIQTSSDSKSVSSSSLSSFSRERSSSQSVGNKTGIHVRDGINQSSETFQIKRLDLTGASTTSDGPIDLGSCQIVRHSTDDYTRRKRIGASANIAELCGRFSKTPTVHSQQKAISAVYMDYSSSTFEAELGSKVSSGQLAEDEYIVRVDREFSFCPVLPIIDRASIKHTNEHILGSWRQIADSFQVQKEQKTEPYELITSIKPVDIEDSAFEVSTTTESRNDHSDLAVQPQKSMAKLERFTVESTDEINAFLSRSDIDSGLPEIGKRAIRLGVGKGIDYLSENFSDIKRDVQYLLSIAPRVPDGDESVSPKMTELRGLIKAKAESYAIDQLFDPYASKDPKRSGMLWSVSRQLDEDELLRNLIDKFNSKLALPIGSLADAIDVAGVFADEKTKLSLLKSCTKGDELAFEILNDPKASSSDILLALHMSETASQRIEEASTYEPFIALSKIPTYEFELAKRFLSTAKQPESTSVTDLSIPSRSILAESGDKTEQKSTHSTSLASLLSKVRCGACQSNVDVAPNLDQHRWVSLS